MSRRPHRTDFSRALGAIYDAGLDGSKWPEALGTVAGRCGGIAAQMHVRRADEESVFGCVAGLPPEAHSEYIAHYAELDVRFERLRSLPKGQVYLESDLISPDEIKSSPIYNELLPRYDLGTVMVADLPARSLTAFFSILSEIALRRFDRRNVREFHRFLPHLARAIEIQARLHQMEDTLNSSHEALESLAIGIVLIDGQGRVGFANRKALRLASNSGMGIGRAGVVAPPGSPRTRLESLVSGALRTARGDGEMAGGVLRVPAATGSIVLQVVPLPRSGDAQRTGAWRGVEAMIILGSATDPDPPPTRPLRELYGLTPAEADLAARLLQGQNVEEIAAGRSVSVHTVRVQLKAVLSKAEVSRQAEFVAKTWRALAGIGVS